jgi:tRNA modification GTPase
MTRLVASLVDTIAAPATPPGRGALAVARVSGPQALAIWRACFRRANGQGRLDEPEPRRAYHGFWIDPASGEALDEVIALFYRGPASFAGEDSLEITCHGSDLILGAILDACFRAGARPALPGEFSQRAFENGKMDLAQARAVAELIDAETAEARRQALLRLRGGLSEKIHEAESALIDAAALIEAYLDFPEEDVGAADSERIGRQLELARSVLAGLLATHRRGSLLQKGARVAIVGRPNAGKSSLFNALVGAARAIVSPHPGTTRDAIEARLDLGGLAVALVDTAGLRPDPEHEVEALGIERTREELSLAQLAVWVIDPLDDPARQLADALALAQEARSRGAAPSVSASLIVFSKKDLCPGASASLGPEAAERVRALSSRPPLETAASSAESSAQLAAAMREALLGDGEKIASRSAVGGGVLCADAEQARLLGEALSAVVLAQAAFGRGESGELVMVDAEEALDSLSRLTGTSVREETLNRIFRQFCLGK